MTKFVTICLLIPTYCCIFRLSSINDSTNLVQSPFSSFRLTPDTSLHPAFILGLYSLLDIIDSKKEK